MADEIRFGYTTGATLTAKVYNAAGTQQGSDVTMTEAGSTGHYSGDMPGSTAAGVYDIFLIESSDIVGTGVIDWNGSAEITRSDMTTATGFSTHAAPDLSNLDAAISSRSSHAAPDLSNLDVAVSSRSSHAAPDLSNLDATISSRSSHSAADVWTATTRTLSSFGTLVADIWSHATRTLSAFGFTVTTDSASRTASQADLANVALEATLTAMKGATFDGATDSLEAIRDRGDAAWVTGGGGSYSEANLHTHLDNYANKNNWKATVHSLNDIADTVLTRDLDDVSGKNEHSISGAVLFMLESERTPVSNTQATLTVKNPDGTTLYTKTLTLDENLNPVSGVT